MRKILKIILAVIAVFVIGVAAFAAIVFLDVSAYTATGSQTLSPMGPSVGKALVVYDPGLSGAATKVAQRVATDLQAQNYTVTYAGIKSSAASTTADYEVVAAGGPIYAGAPSSSVKDFVNGLNSAEGVAVGVFGSGSGAEEGNDVELIQNLMNAPSGTVIVKIGQNEDIAARAADFVNRLLSQQGSLGMLP